MTVMFNRFSFFRNFKQRRKLVQWLPPRSVYVFHMRRTLSTHQFSYKKMKYLGVMIKIWSDLMSRCQQNEISVEFRLQVKIVIPEKDMKRQYKILCEKKPGIISHHHISVLQDVMCLITILLNRPGLLYNYPGCGQYLTLITTAGYQRCISQLTLYHLSEINHYTSLSFWMDISLRVHLMYITVR